MSRGEDFLGCSQDVFHRNRSEDNPFCSPDDWQGPVACLAQELLLLGYANICPSEGNFDVVTLINCTWSLLQHNRIALKTIADLECQVRRLTSDVDNLHMTTSRQRELLDLKDRQCIEGEERERKSNLLLLSAQQLLKTEKEETRRLTGLLLYRENQYQHESKRKEMEIGKMKERIMKLLVEKSCNNVGGSKMGTFPSTVNAIPALEMTALVNKPDGMARNKWRTETLDQTREDAFYTRIINDLKDKLNLVSSENIQIRDQFQKLQNDLEKLFKDRNVDHGRRPAAADDDVASIHLPFSLSRESIEKRSKDICQNLAKMFENLDKKVKKINSDFVSEASIKNVRESECDVRLKNQLAQAKKEIESLQDKLERSKAEAAKLELKKRTILTEDFVLKAVRPVVEDCGAPSWALGRPNVTPRRPGGHEPASPGITIVPVYNCSRIQMTSAPTSRRSASGSRDSGSGSDVSVVKRRSPISSRSPPPSSSHASSRISPVRISPQRPRSANLTGTTPLPKGRHPSRAGSLSPTSTNRQPQEIATRSLPRSGVVRKLNLQRPLSGSRTSDSEDAATASKPPISGSIPARNATRFSHHFATGKRTPSPSLKSSQAPSSGSSSDELTLQLQLLGQFIEQRQLLSDSGQGVDNDDSEMNTHLENVRRALGSRKN